VTAVMAIGDLTGLLLLGVAVTAAVTSWDRGRHRRPARPLVEDRVAGAAALELEEAVGAGGEQHPVPEAGGVLAARDR
jgi:hypothetical protein